MVYYRCYIPAAKPTLMDKMKSAMFSTSGAAPANNGTASSYVTPPPSNTYISPVTTSGDSERVVGAPGGGWGSRQSDAESLYVFRTLFVFISDRLNHLLIT